jgi:hypothetical protein
MTPVEIFEYKMRWMPGFQVPFHSDWRSQAVLYCKKNFPKERWAHTTYTDVYEDTMCFEVNQDADKFHIFMKKIQNTY